MLAADKIYQCLLDKVASATGKPDKILIGLTWTLTQHEGVSGLAMSPGYLTRTLPWSGSLCDTPISEIANWIRSWNGFEASVAMSSINAVINRDSVLLNSAQTLKGEGSSNLSVFEHFLPLLKNKKVVVVGRYPGLEKIEQLADLTVLERNQGDSDLPDPACEFVIPTADWVFLSATTIVNKTFPRLAELASNANLVLMGPTLPWIEELSEFGVDYLAGVRICDPGKLESTVAEGGGTRIFEQAVEYCVYDFSKKHMEQAKRNIANVVEKREGLKEKMNAWYQTPGRGGFPQKEQLMALDQRLSSLDLRYKRLWDANQIQR